MSVHFGLCFHLDSMWVEGGGGVHTMPLPAHRHASATKGGAPTQPLSAVHRNLAPGGGQRLATQQLPHQDAARQPLRERRLGAGAAPPLSRGFCPKGGRKHHCCGSIGVSPGGAVHGVGHQAEATGVHAGVGDTRVGVDQDLRAAILADMPGDPRRVIQKDAAIDYPYQRHPKKRLGRQVDSVSLFGSFVERTVLFAGHHHHHYPIL